MIVRSFQKFSFSLKFLSLLPFHWYRQCTLYLIMWSFCASEHTSRGSIILQNSCYIILEKLSLLSYSSILNGFGARVCACYTQLCAHLKPVCIHACTQRSSKTFLRILKHVQVISSDSRQMRKNVQIGDRPTDRPTDGQTWVD